MTLFFTRSKVGAAARVPSGSLLPDRNGRFTGLCRVRPGGASQWQVLTDYGAEFYEAPSPLPTHRDREDGIQVPPLRDVLRDFWRSSIDETYTVQIEEDPEAGQGLIAPHRLMVWGAHCEALGILYLPSTSPEIAIASSYGELVWRFQWHPADVGDL